MKRIQVFILLTVLLSCLISCKKSTDEEDSSPFKGVSAKLLYADAKKLDAKKQYASAIKRYEALESLYPFSAFAQNAQMHLIEAYYNNDEFIASAAAAERFIHLYPRAKHVDRAYYFKALANFQQVRGPLASILPMDESWRDPGTQVQAYADFALLIQRFPDSSYKKDALARMTYLRNNFAERELNTADYYFKRKMYVAAAERASILIKTYPQASSAKAALALLYHANKALGLEKAAQDALTVYQATYHSSPS